MLATCSSDGSTVLWDLLTGQKLVTFIQPSRLGVRVCRFSPNASFLLTGGDDDSFCVWDISSGCLKTSYPDHGATIFAADFTPDGENIITADANGDMWLWSLANTKCLIHIEQAHDLGVLSLDFCPERDADRVGNWEDTGAIRNEYELATSGNDDR